MTQQLRELAEFLEVTRPDCIVSTEIAFGELNVTVTQAALVAFCEFLKNDQTCRFSTLVDITAIDRPARERRFDVVYQFLSMFQNQRIRVRTEARADDLVPSITDIYPAANWFEREVYDMFGLIFSGHPDLRRILTDYGFRGHPLRKDFPTTGYTEVRYDEVQKRVVYEPVSLTQEFRSFDYSSPWEGVSALPGDEKAEEEAA